MIYTLSSASTFQVVHNYGHGANGVTLSWGTSLRAARMAKEWAQEITPSARL